MQHAEDFEPVVLDLCEEGAGVDARFAGLGEQFEGGDGCGVPRFPERNIRHFRGEGHCAVHGDGGTCEHGATREADNAVAPDFGGDGADGVASGFGVRRCHAVGCENACGAGFCVPEGAEGGWGEMDSVGDERGAEGVFGHLGDDGVSVSVEEAGAPVTEVGGEEGAGAEGFLDVVAGGHGVAESGDDVVVGEIFDERDGSLGFGREGDHGDATLRGFLEGLEGGAVGGLNRVEGVGASGPVLGTDERAFEVEAWDLGAVG